MKEEQNVIPFPSSNRPRVQRAQKERRDRDLLRLREIEDRGDTKKGRLFVALRDRITAGMATGRMLREAKASGITMQAVKDAFAGKFGASGRIDRYSLSPKPDPASTEAREQADRKLIQKVRGYLKLAEVIAELMDRDGEDAKIEVLKDTSLWPRRKAATDDTGTDERAWHLALMLREMGQSVIRRENLAEHFAIARKIPGQWDFVHERFRPSKQHCLVDSRYRYEDWPAHWEEAPLLPGVPLVRRKVAQFSASVVIDSKEVLELPDDYLRHPDEIQGQHHAGCIQLFREIRLCLGPTIGPDSLGTLFESRPYLELQWDTELDASPIEPFFFLDQFSDFYGYILVDGSFRRFKLLDTDDSDSVYYYWPIAPLDRECSFEIEHYYLSWTAVNAAYVSHWLDCEDACYAFSGSGARPEPREQWYGMPSAASYVERELVTGAIEDALTERVHAARKALTQREVEWRLAAQETTTALIERWNENDRNEP